MTGTTFRSLRLHPASQQVRVMVLTPPSRVCPAARTGRLGCSVTVT